MDILVVEDDPVSRRVLTRSVLHLKHTPVEANDGEAGLALWRKGKQRIVISDWQMPKLDGLKLCTQLRAEQGMEYVYFILVTGTGASARQREAAADAGVDDFITKPIDIAGLWMRLRVAERILKYTTQVQQLEELLPMCSYCKKVRDDKNYWSQIEAYMSEHQGAEISHSVCPDCYQKVVIPELAKLKQELSGL